MLFDVIAWSQQKVLVALRIDAAVDPDALTPLDFDAAGMPVVAAGAGLGRAGVIASRVSCASAVSTIWRARTRRPSASLLQIGWGTTSEW